MGRENRDDILRTVAVTVPRVITGERTQPERLAIREAVQNDRGRPEDLGRLVTRLVINVRQTNVHPLAGRDVLARLADVVLELDVKDVRVALGHRVKRGQARRVIAVRLEIAIPARDPRDRRFLIGHTNVGRSGPGEGRRARVVALVTHAHPDEVLAFGQAGGVPSDRVADRGRVAMVRRIEEKRTEVTPGLAVVRIAVLADVVRRLEGHDRNTRLVLRGDAGLVVRRRSVELHTHAGSDVGPLRAVVRILRHVLAFPADVRDLDLVRRRDVHDVLPGPESVLVTRHVTDADAQVPQRRRGVAVGEASLALLQVVQVEDVAVGVVDVVVGLVTRGGQVVPDGRVLVAALDLPDDVIDVVVLVVRAALNLDDQVEQVALADNLTVAPIALGRMNQRHRRSVEVDVDLNDVRVLADVADVVDADRRDLVPGVVIQRAEIPLADGPSHLVLGREGRVDQVPRRVAQLPVHELDMVEVAVAGQELRGDVLDVLSMNLGRVQDRVGVTMLPRQRSDLEARGDGVNDVERDVARADARDRVVVEGIDLVDFIAVRVAGAGHEVVALAHRERRVVDFVGRVGQLTEEDVERVRPGRIRITVFVAVARLRRHHLPRILHVEVAAALVPEGDGVVLVVDLGVAARRQRPREEREHVVALSSDRLLDRRRVSVGVHLGTRLGVVHHDDRGGQVEGRLILDVAFLVNAPGSETVAAIRVEPVAVDVLGQGVPDEMPVVEREER